MSAGHGREHDPRFLRSLDEAATERSIPEKRIPWDKTYDLSEDELDELLASL